MELAQGESVCQCFKIALHFIRNRSGPNRIEVCKNVFNRSEYCDKNELTFLDNTVGTLNFLLLLIKDFSRE